MPRMDLHMSPDELSQIRETLNDAFYRYQDRNYRQSEWRYDRNPVFEVWDPATEQYDRSLYAVIGPNLECNFCTSRSQRTVRENGCRNCRPELWQACGCGDAYMVGIGCGCWRTCNHCSRRGYMESPVWDESSDVYCDSECAESAGLSQCSNGDEYDDDCGTYTADDSGMCRDHRPCDCNSRYCAQCANRGRIHSYSYKPTPRFLGEGPLYLGLESEINTGMSYDYGVSDIARYVNEELGHGKVGYLKSDGSVGCGFEMVTHPMSYRYAMEEFPWHLYGELTGTYRLTDSDDCGIHVHASRAGFSGTRHLYMWQKFFYRNQRPIQQIARRTDSQWCRFTRDARDAALFVAKAGGNRTQVMRSDAWYLPAQFRRAQRVYGVSDTYGPNMDRYSAINTQNRETLEVRVFAGSVHAEQVQAALGLVHASIEYTRGLDAASVIKKEGWGWGTFRNWVNDHNEYTPLSAEIERLVTA